MRSWIEAFVTIVALLAVASPGGACRRVPTKELEVPPEQVTRQHEPGAPVEVVSVGDIILGDAARKDLEQHGLTWPFEFVRPLLADADLLMGNLEAPITRARQRAYPNKRWSYKMKLEVGDALRNIGFDALCLANNHAMDYGEKGLSDTVQVLKKAGLQPFGGGKNEAEARRGLVFDLGGYRVGLLGYYEKHWNGVRQGWYATRDGPGSAALEDAALGADIRRMRQYADQVIVTFHWGQNYKPVNRFQQEMGRRAIELGADVVNGHHPHIAQGIEVYKGKPIVYSVGNFTFGTPGRFKRGKQGYGLVVRYVFGDNGLEWLFATPIAVNNRIVKFQPRRVPADEARNELEPRLDYWGTRARWQDDTAFIGFFAGWEKTALPELPWSASPTRR